MISGNIFGKFFFCASAAFHCARAVPEVEQVPDLYTWIRQDQFYRCLPGVGFGLVNYILPRFSGIRVKYNKSDVFWFTVLQTGTNVRLLTITHHPDSSPEWRHIFPEGILYGYFPSFSEKNRKGSRCRLRLCGGLFRQNIPDPCGTASRSEG